MVSKKQKTVCLTLNYIEFLLYAALANTGCVAIFAFASLIGILIDITSSAVALKIFVITARTKTSKSIIEKTKKNHMIKWYC